MLINCPECNHDVSDKASFCPHCGYPFQTSTAKSYSRKSKRMRLPNGFGQISEIKGRNLRKPFRAMVTIGKDENGRPICKILKPEGYFETYNEAYTALINYNKDPVTKARLMTVGDVYEEWSRIAYDGHPSRERNYTNAWKRVQIMKDMTMSEVRVIHIKHTMEYNDPGKSTIRDIKTLWSQLFKYALEYDIADKNYAELCSIPENKQYKPSESAHFAFSEEDIKRIEESPDMFSKVILFQCYTGFRPNEVCEIKKCNVDLENWFITAGQKTRAGTNRQVPIHTKIRDIVTEAYNASKSEYLFNHKDRPYKYTLYLKHFHACIKASGADENHTPHDCRKHFVTMAKKYKVDDFALKRIVGHSIADLTERVYTERDNSWLMSEILKIK